MSEQAIHAENTREVPPTREEAIKKYFTRTPAEPKESPAPQNHVSFVNLFIGIITVAVGLDLVFDANRYEFIGGIAFLIIGILVIFYWFGQYTHTDYHYESENKRRQDEYESLYGKTEPKPTDTEVSQWLKESIDEIKEDLIADLHLEQESLIQDKPLQIITVSVGNDKKFKLRKGNDNILRGMLYNLTFIFLTSYHLSLYDCQLELAPNKRKAELKKEFYFDNIVSVYTERRDLPDGGIKVNVLGQRKQENYKSMHYFIIETQSGERFEKPLINEETVNELIRESHIYSTNIEEIIGTIHQHLRTYKQSLA